VILVGFVFLVALVLAAILAAPLVTRAFRTNGDAAMWLWLTAAVAVIAAVGVGCMYVVRAVSS
jgi:hypothetical protein